MGLDIHANICYTINKNLVDCSVQYFSRILNAVVANILVYGGASIGNKLKFIFFKVGTH
jgi:hypothetical protein